PERPCTCGRSAWLSSRSAKSCASASTPDAPCRPRPAPAVRRVPRRAARRAPQGRPPTPSPAPPLRRCSELRHPPGGAGGVVHQLDPLLGQRAAELVGAREILGGSRGGAIGDARLDGRLVD